VQFHGAENVPAGWYLRRRGEVERDGVALNELRERIKCHRGIGSQRAEESHLRREPARQRRALHVLRLLGGQRCPDGIIEREHALECIASAEGKVVSHV